MDLLYAVEVLYSSIKLWCVPVNTFILLSVQLDLAPFLFHKNIRRALQDQAKAPSSPASCISQGPHQRPLGAHETTRDLFPDPPPLPLAFGGPFKHGDDTSPSWLVTCDAFFLQESVQSSFKGL